VTVLFLVVADIVAPEDDDDDVEEFLESEDDWDGEEDGDEEEEALDTENEEIAKEGTPDEVLAVMDEAAALKIKAKREKYRRRAMKNSFYLSRYLRYHPRPRRTHARTSMMC
jgi:hypothetical protein